MAQASAAYNAKPRELRKQRENAIEQIAKKTRRQSRRPGSIDPDERLLRATRVMHAAVANADFKKVGILDPNALRDDMDGELVAQQYGFMTQIAPRRENTFRTLGSGREAVTLYPLLELIDTLTPGADYKESMLNEAQQLATEIREFLANPRLSLSFREGFFSLPEDFELGLNFLPSSIVSFLTWTRREGFLEMVIQPSIPFALYEETLAGVLLAIREGRDSSALSVMIRVSRIFSESDELALAAHGLLVCLGTPTAHRLSNRLRKMWRDVVYKIVDEQVVRVAENLKAISYTTTAEEQLPNFERLADAPKPPSVTVIRRGTLVFSGREKNRTDDLRPWPDASIGSGLSSGVNNGIAQKWFALNIANSMQYMTPYLTPDDDPVNNPSMLRKFCAEEIGWLTVFQARQDLPLLNMGDPATVAFLTDLVGQYAYPDDPIYSAFADLPPWGLSINPVSVLQAIVANFYLFQGIVRRRSDHTQDGYVAQLICYLGYGGWLWPGSDDFVSEIMLCQDTALPVSENKLRYVGALTVDSPELMGAASFCSPAYLQVDSFLDPNAAIIRWLPPDVFRYYQGPESRTRFASGALTDDDDEPRVNRRLALPELASERQDAYDRPAEVSDERIAQALASGRESGKTADEVARELVASLRV